MKQAQTDFDGMIDKDIDDLFCISVSNIMETGKYSYYSTDIFQPRLSEYVYRFTIRLTDNTSKEFNFPTEEDLLKFTTKFLLLYNKCKKNRQSSICIYTLKTLKKSKQSESLLNIKRLYQVDLLSDFIKKYVVL